MQQTKTALILGHCNMRMFALEKLLPNGTRARKREFKSFHEQEKLIDNEFVIALCFVRNGAFRTVIENLEKRKLLERVIILYAPENAESVRIAYNLGVDKFINARQREYLLANELSDVMDTSMGSSHFPVGFTGMLTGNCTNSIRLNSKESEVLSLIWEGCNNIEISMQLNVSERTVERYRGKLLKQSGAKNLSGMLRVYLKMGILSQ
jgi:DNA-binding NarL/FixJ family response regulator